MTVHTVIYRDLTLDKEDIRSLFRSFDTKEEAETFAQSLLDMQGNEVVDIEEEEG